MCLLKVVLCLTYVQNVYGQNDLLSYRNLPPLYTFHNYDDCFNGNIPSTYCVLYAEIQPKNHSALWHRIESASNDSSHHFRHDHLFYGLCVEQCREVLKKAPRSKRKLVGVTNVTMDNAITDYYRKIYAANVDHDRQLYYKLLDTCVNYEFQQKYNLTLNTYIEYCNTPEKDSKIDYHLIILYVIILLLSLTSIFSSAYDYHLKWQQKLDNLPDKDFYSKELNNLGSSILTSFSMCRNYKKLISINNNEFQFIYAFRVIIIFFVIVGHIVLISTSLPLANPEYIENSFKQAYSIVFQNGTSFIQMFFVLTGFLLKLKFDQQQLIKPETGCKATISLYLLSCVHRYLRIIPSLAILLYVHTLLHHLGDGPFWRHLVEGERVYCTEYWWKNALLINNFMMEESCVRHTWYLATDMQLYAFYLIVLIVTSKFTQTKKPLYILLGLLAFIVPGALTYLYRLDAAPYTKPESTRYLFVQDVDTFFITFCPSYCNLGGYLVGIICAEIYTKSKRFHKICGAWQKYTKVVKIQLPLLFLVLVISFGLLASGLLVINRNTEEPSIVVALYAACYRNLWAIFGGFLFIGMLLKFGWIAYEMFCSVIFRWLGRITFQMYLWHFTILAVLFGYYRQTVYITGFFVCCQIILAFILTAMLAFLMTLFVEYPIGNIINLLLKRAMKPKRKIEDGELKSYNETMNSHVN